MKKIIVNSIDQLGKTDDLALFYPSADLISSASLLDSSGNNKTLTNNTVIAEMDNEISCLQFNGTSDYLYGSGSNFISNPNLFSICIKFKVRSGGFSAKQTLLSFNSNNATSNKFSLEIANTDRINLYIPPDVYPAYITGLNLVIDTWYSLVVTRDIVSPNPYVFYFNGNQIIPTYSATSLENGDCVAIGYQPTVGNYFNGLIYDVRAYNDTLTETEARVIHKLTDSSTIFQTQR